MPGYEEWDPSLLTGDSDVDAQHMSLFALVASMHKLVVEGKGNEAVAGSMDAIVDYVHTHFVYEEALMTRIGFPELEPHLGQHRWFTEQVTRLRDDLASGHTISPQGMMDFMRSWLVDHIKTEDRKIGDYIRSYGQ